MDAAKLFAEIDRVYREVWSTVGHDLRLVEFGRRMYELGAGNAGEGWQRFDDAQPREDSAFLIAQTDGVRHRATLIRRYENGCARMVIRKPDGTEVLWTDDLKWKYFY